jgi:SAM-dependent methyltransferase
MYDVALTTRGLNPMSPNIATWYYVIVYTFFALVWAYDFYERKTGVPTFPTMPSIRRKILDILQNEVQARRSGAMTIIDLGSGSGQLCAKLARALPEARVIGIELSYVPWLRSVVRQRLFGPKNLEFKRLDFWPYDLSSADAVVTYLPGKIMERVGEKLRKELKPGTLVVANTFPLRAGWKPVETFTLHAPLKTNVYVYRPGLATRV